MKTKLLYFIIGLVVGLSFLFFRIDSGKEKDILNKADSITLRSKLKKKETDSLIKNIEIIILNNKNEIKKRDYDFKINDTASISPNEYDLRKRAIIEAYK